MWRLSSLYKIWMSGDAAVKSQAEVGLRRILLGEQGMRVGSTSRNGVELSKLMAGALREAMRTPVRQLLLDCDEINSSVSDCAAYRWSPMWEDHTTQFHPICDGMLQKIVDMRNPVDIDLDDLRYYKRARYMQRGCTGPQRSYRYNVVECGEAISAIVCEDGSSTNASSYVRTVTDGSGSCNYYVIAGIIGNTRTEEVWIVCKELVKVGTVHRCLGSVVQFLKLDMGCRRVALVHSCEIGCVRRDGQAPPRHNETCLEGGNYYVLDRAGGYPPFQG